MSTSNNPQSPESNDDRDIHVGGNVGPGAVAGKGDVHARDIIGRDQYVHYYQPPATYKPCFTAPPPPPRFVQRPKEFDALVSRILDTDHAQPVAITTATLLHGAGGFGKTTLAQAICRHLRENEPEAFPDGILWIVVGQKADSAALIANQVKLLTGEQLDFPDVDAAAAYWRELLKDKRALVVLDDVWNDVHAAPFLWAGPGVAYLVTTRLQDLAVRMQAQPVEVDEMTTRESVELLTAGIEPPPDDLAPFHALAARLGEWPLMLELAGAALRARLGRGDTLEGALTYLNTALDRRGPGAFDLRNAAGRNQAVSASMDLSMSLLDEAERARYEQLGIFPEDTDVPLSAVGALWDMDAFNAEEAVQRLAGLSLLKFDLQGKTVRLHDVVRDYLAERLGDNDAVSAHGALVDAWAEDLYDLPDDYAWRWYTYHLKGAGREDALRERLVDFEWVSAKQDVITDINTLLADYDLVMDEQIADIIDATATWLTTHPQDSYVHSARLVLVDRRGTKEQIADTVDATATWLAKRPQGTYARAIYLSVTNRHGTNEQIVAALDATATWLVNNPQDSYSHNVYSSYFVLVERRGTQEQIAATLDATATWLAHNLHDNYVRAAYLGLVERRGTQEQITATLDATATWLAHNPQDAYARNTYLGFVDRRGTQEQITAALDATATWLAHNPQDAYARNTYLGFVDRRGTQEQITAALDATATWLAHNLWDVEVRRTYLGFVDRRGTQEQIADALDATAKWLANNLRDDQVRSAYLGFVDRRGTQEQITAALDATATWLAHNPQDDNVRAAYLGLVDRRGTQEQIAATLDATATWLAHNLWGDQVRARYLGFVERRGTKKQIADALDATAKWLATHPRNYQVRNTYLGFVDRHGTQEQIADGLDATATWLANNPQDANVRNTYLGFVERHGTQEQIAATLDATATWLANNPQDANVRNTYLGFVGRHGTKGQIAATLDATARWLANNPQDTNVRTTHLDFVGRHGTKEQIADILTVTATWLATHLEDNQVRATYLGLMARQGTKEQIIDTLDATAEWLVTHPQDNYVRTTYLGLMDRYGTKEQVTDSIDATAEWLVTHPQDNCVRATYLGLVDRYGTKEQVTDSIDATAKWLTDHLQDTNVRKTYLGLVDRRGTKEQIVDAIDTTTKWFENNTKTRVWSILFAYASILFKLEKYSEAEFIFRRVLEIHKGCVPARIGLAWAFYRLSRKPDAFKELKHAQWWAKNKESYPLADALHHLGRYYLLEEDLTTAIEYFQEAIQLSPGHYGNYWQLGRALLAQRKYYEALDAFEATRERLPNNISDAVLVELEGLTEEARQKCRSSPGA